MEKYNLVSNGCFIFDPNTKNYGNGIPNTRNVTAYRCIYQGKESYSISPILSQILQYFGFKNKYPYLSSNVELVVSTVKPPTDPGNVNNTTRPPVNTDCQIIGYDDVTVKDAKFGDSNILQLLLEIKGEDM